MEQVAHSPVVLRFDPGDTIPTDLLAWATRESLTGSLMAIGAVSRPVLAFYDTTTKTYVKTEYPGEYEVVCCQGTLAHTDQGIRTHIHMSVAGSDGTMIGGHLVFATVSVTLEVIITPFSLKRRQHHQDLWLLSDH